MSRSVAPEVNRKERALLNLQATGGGADERAVGGLLILRNKWTLSLPAKLMLAVLLIGVGFGVVRGVYPFLAVSAPVATKMLVVEGWVHPYAVEKSAEEFRRGGYVRIFTTGGPVVGKGGYVNDFQTSASVGADRLKIAGIPAAMVQMVPSRVNGRDRTYSSAVALREWFEQHDQSVSSFNVVTEGAHARRTRLMFQRAFGSGVKVGVISIRSPDFDAAHWWYYSEGTEEVVQETIGYLYAKFLFPSSRHRQEQRTIRPARVEKMKARLPEKSRAAGPV